VRGAGAVHVIDFRVVHGVQARGRGDERGARIHRYESDLGVGSGRDGQSGRDGLERADRGGEIDCDRRLQWKLVPRGVIGSRGGTRVEPDLLDRHEDVRILRRHIASGRHIGFGRARDEAGSRDQQATDPWIPGPFVQHVLLSVTTAPWLSGPTLILGGGPE
jgi:hypothetical protein